MKQLARDEVSILVMNQACEKTPTLALKTVHAGIWNRATII